MLKTKKAVILPIQTLRAPAGGVVKANKSVALHAVAVAVCGLFVVVSEPKAPNRVHKRYNRVDDNWLFNSGFKYLM